MGKQEKKRDRKYRIPTAYLEALAGNIISTQPTSQILFNTLSGLYSTAFAKGYARRIADAKYFKDKREARFQNEWKNVATYLDDIIHPEKKQK